LIFFPLATRGQRRWRHQKVRGNDLDLRSEHAYSTASVTVPRRCSVEDGNPVRAAHRGLAIEHERARPELRSRPRDRRIAVAPVVTPSGELAPLNETSIVKEPGSVLGQMPVALRLVAALVAVRLGLGQNSLDGAGCSAGQGAGGAFPGLDRFDLDLREYFVGASAEHPGELLTRSRCRMWASVRPACFMILTMSL
jgi:hypothetical protein